MRHADSFEHFVARQLSVTQWEFLADHFNGGKRMVIYDADTVTNDARTRQALVARKLIVLDPPAHQSTRPTHTILTERGHGVMCAALGMMADMLMKNANEPRLQPMEKLYGRGYGFRVVVRDPGDVQHVVGPRDEHR